jgi:hypothetical protein
MRAYLGAWAERYTSHASEARQEAVASSSGRSPGGSDGKWQPARVARVARALARAIARAVHATLRHARRGNDHSTHEEEEAAWVRACAEGTLTRLLAQAAALLSAPPAQPAHSSSRAVMDPSDLLSELRSRVDGGALVAGMQHDAVSSSSMMKR